MGHGDEIVVVDANFTARALSQNQHHAKPILRLEGISLARACQAVLSVFPLDEAVAQPVSYMKVCDTPEGHISAVQLEVLNHLNLHKFARVEECVALERFAFYERAKTAFAFLVTGELRPYGNFIFKKGVISFPETPL
jgi:L-fucose mutarotase